MLHLGMDCSLDSVLGPYVSYKAVFSQRATMMEDMGTFFGKNQVSFLASLPVVFNCINRVERTSEKFDIKMEQRDFWVL